MEPIEISILRGYIFGGFQLPAGAVPMAAMNPGFVCLMADGSWVHCLGHDFVPIGASRRETQIEVFRVVEGELGKPWRVAEKTGLSTRAVQEWKRGRKISVPDALKIAKAMAGI